MYTVQPDNYIYVDLLNKGDNLIYKKNTAGSMNDNICKTAGDKITGIDNPALP